MVKPERRTTADMLAAVTIAAVVAVAAALIWWTSDARATISRPATGPAPSPRLARESPASLKQLWTAPNAPTDQPVVVAGTVVTADGRAVQGRDPVTRPGSVELRPRQRPVRGHRGLPLRGRGLPRRPRLRPGQHDRRTNREPWTRPKQLRRPNGSPCRPMARQSCQRVTPGWNCGARTWSGCSPTARSTRGSNRRLTDCAPGAD